MKDIDVEKILVERIPEIASAYQEERESLVQTIQSSEYEDLLSLAHWKDVDPEDIPVGCYNLIEWFVLPLIISLLERNDDQANQRVSDIFSLFESLAESSEFNVRNIVTVGLCEPLLTAYSDYSVKYINFMGAKTKQLSILLFSDFIIDDNIKQLFI